MLIWILMSFFSLQACSCIIFLNFTEWRISQMRFKIIDFLRAQDTEAAAPLCGRFYRIFQMQDCPRLLEGMNGCGWLRKGCCAAGLQSPGEAASRGLALGLGNNAANNPRRPPETSMQPGAGHKCHSFWTSSVLTVTWEIKQQKPPPPSQKTKLVVAAAGGTIQRLHSGPWNGEPGRTWGN
jgi:hypothetical protein